MKESVPRAQPTEIVVESVQGVLTEIEAGNEREALIKIASKVVQRVEVRNVKKKDGQDRILEVITKLNDDTSNKSI
jgi:hypothetical protein